MNFTYGRSHGRPLLLISLAFLALLVVGSTGMSAATPSAPVPGLSASPATAISASSAALPASALSIDTDWVISNLVSYTDTTILVAGSITVESGGTLSLTGDTVQITEPSALARGFVIESGGSLLANGTTFESTSASDPFWMQVDSGAHLAMADDTVSDLGGPGGDPGLTLDAAGASLNGVTFTSYYEGLIVSADDVTVANCYFGNTTSTSESTYVISTSGSSAGFSLTDSKIIDPSMVGGALSVDSSSDIENNTFTLDPRGTNPTPILMGYSGSDGFVNASGSRFAYNVVSGSDVVDFDSSDVTILHNKISNTGGAEYVHDYGIRAETFNPSGRGIWVNGLTIENNFISNSTSFGIRVEQNITNVVIAHNNITNISTDPQAGVYNGLQTYIGIYLIRGVSNALVYDNRVNDGADQERTTIGTAGIGLESEVDDTTVSDNTVLNTDLGIWVQGDWNDGTDNIGPSLHNTVTGNTIENTLPIVETPLLASAIQNYDWANYTTISDNYISGWNNVPSGVGGDEGEAIHQADLYGTIDGNVIASARVGIVFGYFYGNGVSNGSYNLVYDNTIDTTGSPIVYVTTDSPGPLVEVLDQLGGSSTSGTLPTLSLESIQETDGLTLAEAGGSFSATLETQNPVTGTIGNFTSSIPWSVPSFSVHVAGDLGAGKISPTISAVNATEVTYSVASVGVLEHEVSVDVPAELYFANYSVGEGVGSADRTTFAVSSSNGPAAFSTDATGTLSVSVALENWHAENVTLDTTITAVNGTAEPGLQALIELNQSGQFTSVWVGPTNATGAAPFYGIPSGTSITNVSIGEPGFEVTGFTVASPQPRLLLLNVTVEAVSAAGSSYPITFESEDLAAGTIWWVSLVGPVTENVTSSVAEIPFTLPAGAYSYTFGSWGAAPSASASGAFTVPDSSPVILANFTALAPSSARGSAGVPLGLLVALPAAVGGLVLALLVLGQRRVRAAWTWSRTRWSRVLRGRPPPRSRSR